MNNRKFIHAVILLSVFFSSTALLAQPTEGKDFYLGYSAPSYNSVVPVQSSGYFKTYAIINTFQDNTIYVSYFDRATGKEEAGEPYNMAKRSMLRLPLDNARM